MMFDAPMVLHSPLEDGRHWLTTIDLPPLQIWPVAQNHCRVGHFLATLISAKLAGMEDGLPEELTLSMKDVASVPTLANRYPELTTEPGEARIRLAMMSGPVEPEIAEDVEEEPSEFITPQPPRDWKGGYDEWIFTIGRQLGVNAPEADHEKGHDAAMAVAIQEVQKRLPSLRDRFLAGMDGLNLGLKVGLKTRKGGTEYVWTRATNWSDEGIVDCVLESQPLECKGYRLGQALRLSTPDLVDYAIGSETAGLVDPGLTQAIAEDYGLMLS